MGRAKLKTWIIGLAVAACVVVVLYLGVGGFVAARMLGNTLTVGAPTAQGDGWPAPQRPEDIGYSGDPKVAFGYDFDTVDIPTELGASPAWLVYPALATTSRWAIVIHGIGGKRENGYRFLPVLYDAGMPSLLISYRNDAEAPLSPDGLYGFGLTEWGDLDAAVQYAIDHGAIDVVLVAESMGGAIVGQFLLQSSLADMVGGIVLDAPALDFTAIASAQMARMGLPLAGVMGRVAVWVSGMMLPIKLGQADTIPVLAAFAGPLFLSHGDHDRVVPVATSDTLAALRPDNTVYLRTGADHIQSWQEDPARYDTALRAFLLEIN